MHEVRDEGLESDRVSQEREDVQEDDALFVETFSESWGCFKVRPL